MPPGFPELYALADNPYKGLGRLLMGAGSDLRARRDAEAARAEALAREQARFDAQMAFQRERAASEDAFRASQADRQFVQEGGIPAEFVPVPDFERTDIRPPAPGLGKMLMQGPEAPPVFEGQGVGMGGKAPVRLSNLASGLLGKPELSVMPEMTFREEGFDPLRSASFQQQSALGSQRAAQDAASFERESDLRTRLAREGDAAALARLREQLGAERSLTEMKLDAEGKSPPKRTEVQMRAAAVLPAARMGLSTVDELLGVDEEGNPSDKVPVSSAFGRVGELPIVGGLLDAPARYLQSEQGQRFQNAALMAAMAVVRFQSGANITEEEVRRNAMQFVPEIGDTPATAKQKLDALRATINEMEIIAGNDPAKIPTRAAAEGAVGSGSIDELFRRYGVTRE